MSERGISDHYLEQDIPEIFPTSWEVMSMRICYGLRFFLLNYESMSDGRTIKPALLNRIGDRLVDKDSAVGKEIYRQIGVSIFQVRNHPGQNNYVTRDLMLGLARALKTKLAKKNESKKARKIADDLSVYMKIGEIFSWAAVNQLLQSVKKP